MISLNEEGDIEYMNDNEKERQDKKENDGIVSTLGNEYNESNKSNFKMLFRKLAMKYAIAMFAIIIVVGFIIWALLGAITYIFDLEGDNSTTDVASERLIKEYTTIAKTDDNRYYFKINKLLVAKYLEELNKADYEGYYFDRDPDTDEEKPEFKYDPDDAEILKQINIIHIL